jgi:hypothetical protein
MVKILKKNGQESLSVQFFAKNWTLAIFRPNNAKFLDSQRFLSSLANRISKHPTQCQHSPQKYLCL